MQLSEVKTLAQLEEECLKLEIKKFRADHHVVSAPRRSTTVDPDFAFVDTFYETALADDLAAAQITMSAVKCCQQSGHRRQECTAVRKQVCFRCGKPNVAVRTCPVCSSSGNANYESQKLLLDYIISHAPGDKRPYLQINILGVPIYDRLIEIGLSLVPDKHRCTVANGQSCEVLSFIQVPITLMNKTKVIVVLVLPELTCDFILGIDFWVAMSLVPNLHQDVWHFDEDDHTSVTCLGDESVLTNTQREQLNNLVGKYLSADEKLGLTNATEHDIELLPGTKPIKQRYYSVSPVKQKILNDELEKLLTLVEP